MENSKLKNNSSEMKTVVETFVIEETSELIYDNEQLEKWNELVNELGLTGQTQIVKPAKSPIPFMHLKKSLVNVFETLCPRKVDAEKFNITPIPVEILDLMALSKREGYFDKIQIWYDDKNPDPVCVGLKIPFYSTKEGTLQQQFPTKEEAQQDMNENGWEGEPYAIEWSSEKYLLGKWGDVKQSFDELKDRATKRFIAEKSNEENKKIKEAQRELDDIEQTAFERFN